LLNVAGEKVLHLFLTQDLSTCKMLVALMFDSLCCELLCVVSCFLLADSYADMTRHVNKARSAWCVADR